MYNVFTDFHHSSLLNSLIMLFEGRLGGSVYRPIGMDWHTEGYWKIYDHPATAQQFLGINGATPDGTQPLNNVITNDHGFYLCKDIENGSYNQAITFQRFMNMPIDIVIASIPQHIEPFKKLCEVHPSKPKFIYQVGNNWQIEARSVSNVMASANIDLPPNIHGIKYHQEFDLNIFSPSLQYERAKVIRSFVNCFNVDDLFKSDWQLFVNTEQVMPEFTFQALGGQCRDGAAHGSNELAGMMHNSLFVWHTKTGGDGYGHIVHNAAACGTPLIVRKENYIGKLAEPLMIDGETCITIDGLNIEQIKNKIEHYSQRDEWFRLSNGIYNTFKKNVNFDAEQVAIEQFLKSLL